MPYFERNNKPATLGGATNNIGGNGAGYLYINDPSSPMVHDLVNDLVLANAFDDLTALSGPVSDPNSTTGWYVLEAMACDPLYVAGGGTPSGFGGNQNWRIAINADDSQANGGRLTIAWGTKGQIDEGAAIVSGGVSGYVVDPGCPRMDMIVDSALIGRDPSGNKWDYHYQLVTTDRGFALAVYPSTKENDAWLHRVLCIQRPTNPVTGDIKQTEQAPVFAVHSGLVGDNAQTTSYTERYMANGNNNGVRNEQPIKPIPGSTGLTPGEAIPGWYFGPVRDASNPSAITTEPMNQVSSNLLYTFDWEWYQPSLLDNYNHVIKFPFGMCLAGRHIYLDEMDIMGLVHGATFGFGQESTINLYNPVQARTYAAGPGHFGTRYARIQIPSGSGKPSQGVDITPFSRVVFVKDGPTVLV